MPVMITCPSCQRTMRGPDSIIGKTVKCPACQTQFAVTGGPKLFQTTAYSNVANLKVFTLAGNDTGNVSSATAGGRSRSKTRLTLKSSGSWTLPGAGAPRRADVRRTIDGPVTGRDERFSSRPFLFRFSI